MAIYRYKGIRSDNGKPVDGLHEADSDREARRELRQQGIYTTEIDLSDRVAESTDWRARVRYRRRLATRELVVFTHQLASMLEAGFPLIEALQLVDDQLESGTLKDVTIAIRNDIAEGQSLSQALEKTPQIFSPFYTNLVKAGEASGSLELVLNRLATSLEARQQLKEKLTSAMIYPTIMTLASVGVLVFLMAVVVPNVVQMFADSQQSLPLMTRILIVVSDLVVDWWWAWLILIGSAVGAGGAVLRHPVWRRKLDKQLLRIPFVRKVYSQRIIATLGLLLESGVTIIPALDVSSRVSGSDYIKEVLNRSGVAVSRGSSLSESLRNTGLFSSLALRLIHAGEMSGSQEAMLMRIAQSEESELKRSLERFMSLLEPIIVLAMGLMVGFVAIAVMLPIFEMNTLIR